MKFTYGQINIANHTNVAQTNGCNCVEGEEEAMNERPVEIRNTVNLF